MNCGLLFYFVWDEMGYAKISAKIIGMLGETFNKRYNAATLKIGAFEGNQMHTRSKGMNSE